MTAAENRSDVVMDVPKGWVEIKLSKELVLSDWGWDGFADSVLEGRSSGATTNELTNM